MSNFMALQAKEQVMCGDCCAVLAHANAAILVSNAAGQPIPLRSGDFVRHRFTLLCDCGKAKSLQQGDTVVLTPISSPTIPGPFKRAILVEE